MSTPWIAVAVAGVAAALSGCNNQRADAGPAVAPDVPLRDRTPAIELAPVAAPAMCATHGGFAAMPATPGAQRQAIHIADTAVRAVAPGVGGDAAALRFTYEGPSERVSRLASGQVRRQIGLKLRAEDGCNLIYVMWRLAPESGVEVSIKRNPGARRHSECGTAGYTAIEPREEVVVPRLRAGTSHTLHAEIAAATDELVVWIDDKPVWRGRLPDAARELHGPAGLRTDNAQLDLELLAAQPPAPAPGSSVAPIPGCEPDE